MLGGECILFYSPSAVLCCCAVFSFGLTLSLVNVVLLPPSPVELGNESSRRLKFYNHGEVLDSIEANDFCICNVSLKRLLTMGLHPLA